MKLNINIFLPAIIAFLLLTCGCSQSPEESASAPEPAPDPATKDDLQSGLAELQKKSDDEATKLKAEVAAALAQQKKDLLSEMNANTQNLTSQMTGIKKKYDSLKDSLPEEVLKVVKEQLPDLESSIRKLKDMIDKFDPDSIEELKAFKTKYQKEYEIAQNLIGKVSQILDSAGVKLPKLF